MADPRPRTPDNVPDNEPDEVVTPDEATEQQIELL